MFLNIATISLLAASAVALPTPAKTQKGRTTKRASCTVSSTDADVSDCSTVTIEAFTVADGETLELDFADGATVTMAGDVTFAKTSADGPLLTLKGSDITFDGAGYTFDGNGADYWDGEGTNGGVDKPHPLLKIKVSGTVSDFTVLNSPAQAVSIGDNDALLTVDGVTIDNSAGDTDDLGHNTDGFDASGTDITIQNSKVMNQDDCIAINSGSNIIFKDNTCSGGHGISVGSVSEGDSVSDITISGNTVTNSQNGLRIKVKADADGASVSGVTYTDNTVSGITDYGVLITQSYPDSFGTPGTGSTISDIVFAGTNTVTVDSDADADVAVDCGSCSGTWDFSGLTASGADSDIVAGGADIEGGSY